MKYQLKSAVIALACAGGMMATTSTFAANWLMLQGTEPAAAAPRVKIWGFVQAQYQNDRSEPGPNGNLIPPKLIGPNLTSQSQFNVNRARLGLRGTGMPLDPNINYFLLTEFGNNAITNAVDGATHVTDASITINNIKGARIRLGMFKTPGFEEGLQAIHVFDFINFTTVGNQMMLERFPNATYTANAAGNNGVPLSNSLNAFNSPVGAFRDVGIQVFDSFKSGDMDYSYAWMIGNGNGLNSGDNDRNKDTYVYLSAEKKFGGKGPRMQSFKTFIWSQNGKRELDATAGGGHDPVEHERKRSGVGFKYLKKPFRATVEYLKGEGMIFLGPDKTTFALNANPASDGSDAEASGYYLEGGYYIPGTAWQVDLRYDVYNRLEGSQFEQEFITTTIGTNYSFNKKTRLTINYSDTTAEAINFATGAGPNAQLDGVAERISLQMTHIF